MATPTTAADPGSCLGRTCLKWEGDGALSALDFELVMQRLALVDQDVAALRNGTLESNPCASLS